MQSNLEKFLILFSRLRNETNKSPTNLTWLPTEKSNLASLCYDLDLCYRDILRIQSRKKDKTTIAPPLVSKPFTTYWDDYVTNWQKLVSEAAGPEKERVEKELLTLFQELEENAIANGKNRKEFIEDFRKTLLIEKGDSFSPLIDDPSDLMYDIWGIVDSYTDFGDVIDEKALGAWSFFERTIGVNYSAIYARWRGVPELFIPAHALNRNIIPIVDLYNEAVRAYIFGLTIASVAMCRALLEHILKKHYHIRASNLEEIINLAEERHDHLKELSLQEKRLFGNMVLHKYENCNEEIEKTAIDFLQELRHVVTHIPT